MSKDEIVIIANYEDAHTLTLDELCEICHLSGELLQNLIDYQIIHPQEKSIAEWQFDLQELKRIQTALNLRRDLEVNMAGAALILDLLDELEDLRHQSQLFKKHVLK